MELFAGEAGLTQAVSRLNIPVFEPGEIRVGGRIAVGTDLLCSSTFKQAAQVGNQDEESQMVAYSSSLQDVLSCKEKGQVC